MIILSRLIITKFLKLKAITRGIITAQYALPTALKKKGCTYNHFNMRLSQI